MDTFDLHYLYVSLCGPLSSLCAQTPFRKPITTEMLHHQGINWDRLWMYIYIYTNAISLEYHILSMWYTHLPNKYMAAAHCVFALYVCPGPSFGWNICPHSPCISRVYCSDGSKDAFSGFPLYWNFCCKFCSSSTNHEGG